MFGKEIFIITLVIVVSQVEVKRALPKELQQQQAALRAAAAAGRVILPAPSEYCKKQPSFDSCMVNVQKLCVHIFVLAVEEVKFSKFPDKFEGEINIWMLSSFLGGQMHSVVDKYKVGE